MAFGKLTVIRAQVDVQNPPRTRACRAKVSDLLQSPGRVNHDDSPGSEVPGNPPDRANDPVGSLEFGPQPSPLEFAAV